MTRLEAVNEMLEWINLPPVTALGSAGSDEYEAETSLDRKTREVLSQGWWVNEEFEVDFGVPTIKIGASGGAGTFTYGEVVTQAVSGATGYFAYEESGFVYLNSIAGTFVSSQNLTGGTSGATRTGGTYTAVTTAKIAYPTSILRAVPSVSAAEDHTFAQRGGFFYDTEDNTTTFTSGDGLTLDIVRLLDFDDLPDPLATYIAKVAAYSFMRYKTPSISSTLEDRRLEVFRARIFAIQNDLDLRRTNVHTTRSSVEFLGDRREYQRMIS